MGFFSDLKEDLSQAVNELMPEDGEPQEEGFGDINEMLDRVDSIVVPEAAEEEQVLEEPQEADVIEEPVIEEPVEEEIPLAEPEEEAGEELTEDNLEAELAAALDEDVNPGDSEADMDLEKMLESALAANEMDVTPIYEEKQEPEIKKETKGESKVAELINARMASDETSSVTAGMTINGDVISEGSLDLIGCVNGNIDILGKLNVTGYING
ncbi:MAG: hypothetical protein K2H45_11135, partial [Acetatifactor sp.]|nr:hypothetical protein [Acetatifactor sp.]